MSVYLAILWHMHQPYYFDPLKNKFVLPWVRLHATKDYLDMLLILKNFPEIKVTFNVVPSLLKQIEEYEKGGRDIFFEYSLIEAEELSLDQKIFILNNFFFANWDKMVRQFPRYAELLEKRGKKYADIEKISKKFTAQEIRDLQVLFNLVWIDPLHRKNDPFLKELEKKGKYFTEDEKKLLLDKQIEIMKRIIPTYREMAISGQIELSVTPFYHPILPLIYNSTTARECMPWAVLPENNFYAPEDAEWHVENALNYFKEKFGFTPIGMWPAEGSVSENVLRLIGRYGLKWVATDEEILSKSLGIRMRQGDNLLHPELLYKPYNFEGLNIFFRDRILSDLIGFVYSGWQTEKAVFDFINRIKKAPNESIVSVILDGENAWEYYQNDGFDFLSSLYDTLKRDKEIKTVTFSDYLEMKAEKGYLKKIFPGSWINANFSIWIGHEEDNLSWDYLYKVRQDLLNFTKANPHLNLSHVWEHIYIAEGSDWNWWYGDEHYTETKDVFDEIYRHHLISVYQKIGKEPPNFLYVPISKMMREIKPEVEPKGFIYPKIDGRITGYFEWLEAGKFNIKRMGGSMHRSESIFSYLYYGFNRESLFLRLDPWEQMNEFEELKELKICIYILEPQKYKVISDNLKDQKAILFSQKDEKWVLEEEISTFAFDNILEIELPFEMIKVGEAMDISFFIEIWKGDLLIDRFPHTGFIRVHVPHHDFDKLMWL